MIIAPTQRGSIPIRHRATAPRAATIRPEIQALRAIAVMAVVLYHLWPARVPGGYVGVDVFFAISGFLIIGHLLRDVDRTGRVSLPQFWARRARRLLPASLLVLAVTGIATATLTPTVLWQQWFQEITASALYVQNWLLAFNAVDYLGADNSASPVQHFWSLSVEEQFYIFWPVLIVVILAVSRRRARWRPRRAIGVVLVVLTGASFLYSVIGVATEPAAAYFVTTGRAWEFGAGGLLAYLSAPHRAVPDWLRTAASWGGLAAITASVFLYGGATPFPGIAAGLPVVGTLLVIAAGTPGSRWSAAPLMGWRPVQWIGDVSYSFYLWHWPPIVILPIVTGTPLEGPARVAILAGSLLLAWLTKVLVEDPVRLGRFLVVRPAGMSIAAAVLATAIIAGSSGYLWGRAGQDVAQAAIRTEQAIADQPVCIGALATVPGAGCERPYAVTTLTDPAFAQADIGKGVQVTDRCKQSLDDSSVITCDIGDQTDPVTTLALIGDSHAGQFLEALDRYGKKERMRFVTYLKTWCAGTGSAGIAAPDNAAAPGIDSCARWGNTVLDQVAADPRLDGAIFSNFAQAYATPSGGGVGRPVVAADYVSAWDRILAAGKSVVALRDIPNAGSMNVPECVAQRLADYDPCTVARTDAMMRDEVDPMMIAARSSQRVKLVDLTDVFCDATTCHTVIGGLVVYFGGNHMTATFSRTLAPIVGERIRLAVAR